MKISIIKIEKQIGRKLQRNKKVLGLDIASKTGWAYLTTTENDLIIDYGTVTADSTEPYYRLKKLNEMFAELIKDDLNLVVIESAFLGINKKTYGLLSMFQGLAVSSIYKKDKELRFIYPTSARAEIGLCGNKCKEEVHKEIVEKLKINLDNPDATDAVVLALNGLLEPKPVQQEVFKKKRSKKCKNTK